MRIAVASVLVPFIRGGAELYNRNLFEALKRHGHDVEFITLPFRFGPPSAVHRSMDVWEQENFNAWDVGHVDLVVATKFPAFYADHPNMVVWLMHQHRSVYELWETPFGDWPGNPGASELRYRIIERDTHHLRKARAVHTISQVVSDRIERFNGVASAPLLHPPNDAERYSTGQFLPYIFAPSRLETLKRQDLAIKALQHCDPSVRLVICGKGGLRDSYERLAQELGVADRVMFLGHVSDDELVSWFMNASGVFFAPFDEDYGYVTLEAMLSGKPVITCADSGGPLTFVRQDETGFIAEPDPLSIAGAFNTIWNDRAQAREMGMNGLSYYHELGLSWDHVVETLTSEAPV